MGALSHQAAREGDKKDGLQFAAAHLYFSDKNSTADHHRREKRKKRGACGPQSAIPAVKHGGDRIMLRDCSAAERTGAVCKTDIMRKEDHLDTLKRCLNQCCLSYFKKVI